MLKYNGIPVMKTGRTSGLTFGVCNRIDSTTFLYAHGVSQATKVLVIVGKDDGIPTRFAELGDSGSVVFDKHFRAVAMVMGISNPGLMHLSNMTYCTPIDAILEDAKEKASMDLVVL